MPAKRSTNGVQRAKFQADLAPSDDRLMRALKEDLQIPSNSDLLADALSLFRWAVSERRQGRRIVSEGTSGEKNVLVFPRLERISQHLPQVDIKWTAKELRTLTRMLNAEPAKPTPSLIRALRG